MLYLTLGPLNFESTCTKYRMASDFRGYNRLWFSLIKQGFNIACMHAAISQKIIPTKYTRYTVEYNHQNQPMFESFLPGTVNGGT